MDTEKDARIFELEIRLDAIRVLNDDNQRLVVQQTECLGELVGELEDIGDSCGKIAQISAYNNECEICNECGSGVMFGSGRYVNRIPDDNSVVERQEDMGKPFPVGDFMCIECEDAYYAENGDLEGHSRKGEITEVENV